jgi:multicomponent Na+:H+ antiporter subunit A
MNQFHLHLSLLVSTICLPILAMIVTMVLARSRWSHRCQWVALLPPLFATATGVFFWGLVGANGMVIIPLQWMPEMGMDGNLRIDRLGALFVMLIGLIGTAVVIYSGYYFKEGAPPTFWPLLMGFMASMLGIVLSDSLIVL